MFFPFPVPIVPGGEAGGQVNHIRGRLREYVKQNDIIIQNCEGRVIEIDELLDEALGSAPKVPIAVPIIGIGLLVLFIAWIVIVLVFLR